MHIAPNGAVSKIDTTATVKTISPHANPIAIGIVPMAACTVALGVYAIAQNSRSFLFNSVFISDNETPTILKISAAITNIITTMPAFEA